MPTSGTINPNLFATKWQGVAAQARDADQDHTARIKGTSNPAEIKQSYRDSINSWKPAADRVSLGSAHTSPDGGMRSLAKARGRY